MLNLKRIMFSTIRAKIILVPALGIVGMCVLAGVNQYVDMLKNRDIIAGRQSQAVTVKILQMSMLEEQFINRHDKVLLSAYDKDRKDMKKATADIASLSIDEKTRALAKAVIKAEENHARTFESMTHNIESMEKTRQGLFANSEQENSFLSKIVDEIDAEQAKQMMEGKDLDIASAGVRKDIESILNSRKQGILVREQLFAVADIKKYEKNTKALREKLKLAAKDMDTMAEVSDSAEYRKLWNEAKAYGPHIIELEDSVFLLWQKNQSLLAELRDTGNQVRETASKIVALAKENLERRSVIAGRVNMMVTLCGIIAMLVLGYFICRNINRTLEETIDGLIEASDQVASGAGQVSSSSQSLAEGASEQAASIEETSSSLEEMSSMTKQNAGNAAQADSLMKEANQVVAKANDSMIHLTQSMEEISKASEETSKIIKTIDEIAFQTNLLALNAAVEAARAGEAGAGFAVVSGEVRNLAMRAAEAARNTADLIEGTVKKVKDGGNLVNATSDAFTEVASSAAKVGELVAEIAAASNEQAQGIGQVNTAVAEMDKVVQQNAANAEESASASEEMSAQAEQMKEYVGDLILLVGANNNGRQIKQPSMNTLRSFSKRAIETLKKAGEEKGFKMVRSKQKE
jgi:methyl-accepting chemotaxis protein